MGSRLPGLGSLKFNCKLVTLTIYLYLRRALPSSNAVSMRQSSPLLVIMRVSRLPPPLTPGRPVLAPGGGLSPTASRSVVVLFVPVVCSLPPFYCFIRSMKDELLHATPNTESNFLFLKLDVKAFDRMEWRYTEAILQKFDFGQNLPHRPVPHPLHAH